jgi:hypothetical protein
VIARAELPRIEVLSLLSALIPSPLLPRATEPVLSVPTRLPWMTFPVPAPWAKMPVSPFSDTVLASSSAGPPIVLEEASFSIRTPSSPLPAPLSLSLSPMRLPVTTFWLALTPPMRTPALVLWSIVLLVTDAWLPARLTPSPPLAGALSSPIVLPSITVLMPAFSTCMPVPPLPAITFGSDPKEPVAAWMRVGPRAALTWMPLPPFGSALRPVSSVPDQVAADRVVPGGVGDEDPVPGVAGDEVAGVGPQEGLAVDRPHRDADGLVDVHARRPVRVRRRPVVADVGPGHLGARRLRAEMDAGLAVAAQDVRRDGHAARRRDGHVDPVAREILDRDVVERAGAAAAVEHDPVGGAGVLGAVDGDRRRRDAALAGAVEGHRLGDGAMILADPGAGIWKLMVSSPAWPLALVIAAASEPAPERSC